MMKMKVGILLMAVAVTANTEVVLANDDASETQKKLQMRLQVHRYPWLLPYHGILYLLLNLPVL